jgi:MFS transporter, Spinster family, sphingosine-1-phosphate transporter
MSIRHPYAILAVLSGLNLVNYLDRYIVAAVGPKLAEELGLSDSKFGFVVTAFMIGYFATSPIFGALGDRFPRRKLIALGVAVWSLATVGSGLTETFAAMIASRVVVGIGEASYATLAPTIIDDLAEPAKKNRWLAIFYVAIPVGSALGYLVGGELEHAFGWRSAFFIAGGPGVVLALLALAIEEPKRTRMQNARAPASFGVTAAQLFRIPLYRDTVIGYTAQTFALGGFAAWAPKYLYRVIGLDLKTADYWFGLILVVTGLLATFVGAQLGDRWPGEDRARANLRVCAISTAVSVPFAALCLLSSSAFGFFAAIAAAEFAIFLSTSPINAVILGSVPSELRASAMAASIFAIHLLGDMISPPLIGVISDTSSLRKAMVVLPVALGAATLVWWRQSGQAATAKGVQV